MSLVLSVCLHVWPSDSDTNNILLKVELIIGTAPDLPFIRLCALPGPSFIIFFGLMLLLTSSLSACGARAPFRISSVPKGALLRPTVYTIVEDVIGVGTGTGRRYREALNARYEASPRFRRVLAQLNLFWGLPAILVGVGVTVAIYVPDIPPTVGYGIGMSSTRGLYLERVANSRNRLGGSSCMGLDMGGYNDSMGPEVVKK